MASILVEIAQDIGELQGATQMMGQPAAGLRLKSEDANRQPADRARHAVAVNIELLPHRRADVGDHVHFHAVDDGEKIGLIEAEPPHRFRQIPGSGARIGAVKRLDVGAP